MLSQTCTHTSLQSTGSDPQPHATKPSLAVNADPPPPASPHSLLTRPAHYPQRTTSPLNSHASNPASLNTQNPVHTFRPSRSHLSYHDLLCTRSLPTPTTPNLLNLPYVCHTHQLFPLRMSNPQSLIIQPNLSVNRYGAIATPYPSSTYSSQASPEFLRIAAHRAPKASLIT